MKLNNWILWGVNILLIISSIVLLCNSKLSEISYVIIILTIIGVISVGKMISITIGGNKVEVKDSPKIETAEHLLECLDDPKNTSPDSNSDQK
jgi:hypothetical protein